MASAIYRVIYLSVLLFFLAALVEEIVAWGARQPVLDAALEVAAVAVGLALCLLVAIRFSRVGRSVAWMTTSAWVALFAWYCWFSWRGLFRLHEIHTFDPNAAEREVARHNAAALALFGALTVFFLSFPVLKSTFQKPRKGS